LPVLPLTTGLLRSCHPAPCVAVTLFATILGALAGNSPARCVLLAAAILAGQLSIGWSNDRIDAARDAGAQRRDKPVARGEVQLPVLDRAIGSSLVATVLLSFSLGWRAGSLHCAAVSCGWLYNLVLKSRWLSWLPYALAFGSLPAIATLALPQPRLPGGWIVLAAAALGVVANLTNALPDLDEDARAGIRGLPHRLGARRALAVSAGLLMAATVALTVGPPGPPSGLGLLGLALAVGLVLAGAGWAWRHPLSRGVFYGLIVFVGLQLGLILTSAHQLR
jgi:4-hydroxybenzoate polyprenyltransferase